VTHKAKVAGQGPSELCVPARTEDRGRTTIAVGAFLDGAEFADGCAIVCEFCNFGQTNIQTIMGRISLQAGPPPAFR
jgi:hypothetical protein